MSDTDDRELDRCLIYGAYGYTGDLIARRAATRGQRPILAGRSASKVEGLARELGMESRVFGLDDPAALDAGLEDVDVVVHCAGPFSRTSKPMVDACLRTGTHYLDITGEVSVFEACAARDAEAEAAGVMVMPGTGFDVVPTDCLAAHLSSRLPGATHLTLAFASVGGQTSHGTATTMVENLDQPNLVRRDGELVSVRTGKRRREIDFGRGPKPALGIPWGDVSTAFHSTGIKNIEVFTKVPKAAIAGARVMGVMAGAPGTGLVQRLLKKRIDAGPAGPTDAQRARAFSLIWGQARAGDAVVEARLRTPDGYTLTAHAALEIASRVLQGSVEPGFRTPSMVFGADFVLELDDTERTDVN